ncbi:hypothetical protein ACFQ07_29280, partial [Actinomadura adrarensis]
ARDTAAGWLALLADSQPPALRNTEAALAQRTLALAIVREALLDLLANGDTTRTTTSLRLQLDRLG